MAWLAALSAACVPAAGALSPADAALVQLRFVNAADDSDLLWSVALPRGTRIARFQPVLDASRPLEVHVRLARPYAGAARLHAAVNGSDLGALSLPPETEPDQAEAVVRIPEGVLRCGPLAPVSPVSPVSLDSPLRPSSAASATSAARDVPCPRTLPVTLPPASWRGTSGLAVAEIVLWQDVEDPALRVIAQRPFGGAALGAENSWFFDGESWRSGVYLPATGRVAAGLWHVFLADRHVGR
jgi:hypothetical protein